MSENFPTCSTAPAASAWFVRLEKVLAEQAKLAGLLGHSTLIGNAREVFVHNILKSFLPPSIHVCTGKVVSFANNLESRQIDVILYDSRFPVLEISSGFGMYPIEGVIATIEVKSRCTKNELTIALENCASVLRIPLAFGASQEQRVAELRRDGMTASDANNVVWAEIRPWTYVFSFQSDLAKDSIADVFSQWLDRNHSDHSQPLCLPRMCSLGDFVAIRNVPPASLEALSGSGVNLSDSGAKPVIGISRTPYHFGLFACHLLGAIGYRMSSGSTRSKADLGPGLANLADIFSGWTRCRTRVHDDFPEN